ncbi:flagellar hook-associated protein FlgK [Neiella marina]|uniref:Flagellar hook-associated protein 1 n=1 Tax=Neiella holothuriorum TaxID=2870530 RepID=A0ABS7EF33_9GAMM|nr:flagellar hook-associated protein FlgK [Neiella holothuriorum]MBW8190835.1 flagellar hook-associated protein FlgK [Neiella holothuriorum]
MPVDLYNLGVSGLLTAQQQLSTTSQNIANVDTDGYTRQQVIQGTQNALWEGGNYYGTGVYAQEVRRIYDQFAYNESIYHQSRYSYSETLTGRLQGLDDIMSNVGGNMLDSISEFYDALNSVVDQPTDVGIRQVMLDKAEAMTGIFNSLNASLEAQFESVNTDIETIAGRMDEIGEQVAELNRQIITASGNGNGATPNDLLDRRDQLITELAEYTNVSTVEQASGAVTVIIGNGQTLVADNTAFGVSTIPGAPDVRDIEIVLTQGGNTIPLDGQNLGGQVAALFEYRDEELKLAMNELGLTAIAMSDAFNSQQAQGLDLNESFGNNLFTDINDTTLAQQRARVDTSNTGTSQLQVNITDVNSLTASDYYLQFDGSDYQLTDLDSGTTYNIGAPGAITMPDADGDGVSDIGFEVEDFVVGVPVNGDKWILTPTREFGGDIGVELSDPDQIAASSVFEVYESDTNVSPADVEIISVDPTDPNFATAMNGMDFTFIENPAGSGTIEYDILDPSGTSLIGGATLLGATPAQISYGGVTVEVTGNPIGQASTTVPAGPGTPEVYSVNYAFGPGNNSNAVAMTEFQTTKLVKDGSMTIEGSYQNVVTQIGVHTETAAILHETNTTTFTSATTTLLQAGGVNLDEEASNLLKYQQSYTAAARIVTVAKEITDTLLNSF